MPIKIESRTQDIMVDLETFGRRPGCAMASIGAVAFNPATGEIHAKEFEIVVGLKSQLDLGLHVDEDTMAWWQKQGPEAAKVLKASQSTKAKGIGTALDKFSEYVATFGGPRSVRVWGNGSDFDNAILAVAFGVTGRKQPWEFWNSRCFRTLKGLHKDTAEPTREGTHHNALDDARHQARWALEIFKHRGGK